MIFSRGHVRLNPVQQIYISIRASALYKRSLQSVAYNKRPLSPYSSNFYVRFVFFYLKLIKFEFLC